MVEDKFMKAIMQKQADNLEQCAKKLLDTANANGGVDNSTVILVKYEGQ
jgi:serine/threonine protein phosphatase PrpC